MRRSLASLLLALLIGTFVLPFSQAKQNVPACCRRGGQHHCAASAGNDGFRSTWPSCPFQRFVPLVSHSKTALRASAETLFIALHWHSTVTADSPDIAHRAAGNTQKRGPPLA